MNYRLQRKLDVAFTERQLEDIKKEIEKHIDSDNPSEMKAAVSIMQSSVVDADLSCEQCKYLLDILKRAECVTVEKRAFLKVLEESVKLKMNLWLVKPSTPDVIECNLESNTLITLNGLDTWDLRKFLMTSFHDKRKDRIMELIWNRKVDEANKLLETLDKVNKKGCKEEAVFAYVFQADVEGGLYPEECRVLYEYMKTILDDTNQSGGMVTKYYQTHYSRKDFARALKASADANINLVWS